MMDLHRRMMADPVIRQRVMADSAMRRAMNEMMQSGDMRPDPQMEKAAPKPKTQQRKRGGQRDRTPPPADSLPQHEGHSLDP
jgi:hypothetical protein